jgi:hypothetical protein
MAAVLAMGSRASLAAGVSLRALGWVGVATIVHGCRGSSRRGSRRGWPAHAPRRLVAAVAVGVVGLLAAAVVVPPIESGDVWSYAMYGRIVAVHHASPYRHLPDEYPRDPFLARMDTVYHHTPSRYGPVFSAVAGGVVRVARGSPLATRVLFQGLAALAALACAVLAWRRTSSVVAVAVVGLNPFTVLAVANGGHNDVLVGLAVLAAVALAERRPALAGAVLGAAALVKATALLALPGMAAWLLLRRGRAVAARCAGAGALLVVAGSAAAGGAATLTPLRQARLEVSKASVWHLLHRALLLRHLHHGHGVGAAQLWAGRDVSAAAGLLVAAAAAVFFLSARRDPDAGRAATAPLLAYLLLGAYVLPWYAAWVLPAVVFAGRRRLATFVVALAGLFQLAELPGPRGAAPPLWLHRLQSGALYGAVPLVEATAALALLVAATAGLRSRAAAGAGPSAVEQAVLGQRSDAVSGRAEALGQEGQGTQGRAPRARV